MVVLSNGVDTGNTATLTEAIQAAQRADTLVYPGASFFEVSKKQGIDQIYQAIREELRSQCNLGVISDHPNEISEFRTLKVSSKQKGLVVQSREQYWAKADTQTTGSGELI